jgi:steroid delta-isomerase-like uncharacterized protein
MIRSFALATLTAVLLVAVTGVALAGDKTMDNKALMQKFYDDVANGGKMDMIDTYMSKDFVEHEMFPGMAPGREGCRQFFTMMRTAFPDMKFTVEFMLADGDKVAAYVTMSGTQKGEFMGMPASGKSFSAKTVDIVRIVDGKAVEHWGATDSMSMMQQLGGMAGMQEDAMGHKGQ